LVVDDAFNRAVAARDGVFAWGWEEAEEPRGEVEGLAAQCGLQMPYRRICRPWSDMRQRTQAMAVEAALSRLRALDREFERVRRMVAAWDPVLAPFLSGDFDEHVEILVQLGAQCQAQADEVCTMAVEARRQVDERLEAALAA
jgi:hypothetical protein